MTKPGFEAFKLAFQDPESRVRLNSDVEEKYYSQLTNLKITGGYLDNLCIEFSEHLNAVIGGRGTGKSTLLECLRYVLGKTPIGKNAQKQHTEIIKENIGKNKARIDLSVLSSAMQLALHRLLDEDVNLLKGKRLDKDYFNMLLTGGDPVRDVLQWLDQGDSFQASRGEHEWKAFCEVCKSQLAFSPLTEGVLEGCTRLANHKGPWLSIWERFCEAPGRYPNIPAHIRKCSPPSNTLIWLSHEAEDFEGWPQWNEAQEKSLQNELMSLASLPPHDTDCFTTGR